MNELSEFQAQAAGVALHKLLYGSSFYISDFDALAKLLGKEVEKASLDYQALHGLHCISWSDMPEAMRARTREKVCELLGVPLRIFEGEASKEASASAGRAGLRLAFWRKPGG